MKNKVIYILIVAGFSTGFFFLGWHMHQLVPISTSTSMANLKVEKSETARLAMDGYELKILTNTYFYSRNFIFLDNKTGDIVTTLSIENPARELPYYSIVKGRTHDWLVVTRLENWGSGLQYNKDEWYILGSSGRMKMVLSYRSESSETSGGKSQHMKTYIMNESYSDDSAVDVRFTEKFCSTTEEGKDKDCSESSKVNRYVWDDNQEKFLLKNK